MYKLGMLVSPRILMSDAFLFFFIYHFIFYISYIIPNKNIVWTMPF